MMSSKLFQVYYLTEYSFGRTIQAWPKSRFKATSANGANTLGFHGKGMTKNPRCVRVANRLTGIHPASRTAKRQSGARTGLYACMSTMTVTESSCRMTRTVSVRVIKQSTAPPIWGFSAKGQVSPVEIGYCPRLFSSAKRFFRSNRADYLVTKERPVVSQRNHWH